MAPEGASFSYAIEWSPTAEVEIDQMRAFDARAVLHAIELLAAQAEVETRNRKPLRHPLEEIPVGAWEVRVGAWRILYEVKKQDRIVRILRVILKGRQSTQAALREPK